MSIVKDYAPKYRKMLIDAVKRKYEEAGEKEVALLFSGGTDSTLILFSFLELGIKPVCYTFGVKGYKSGDIKKTKELADFYKLDHKIIEIEPDVVQLEKDVRYLIGHLRMFRKTVIQCMHPIMYVVPQVKEKVIFNGLNADSLYGTSRKICIEGRDSVEKFVAMRKEESYDPTLSDHIIKAYIEEHGIKCIDPYREPEIEDLFFNNGFSWFDMNKPKEKMIAYLAFQDYYENGSLKIYRRSSSYQIEAKLREYHDLLLDTDLNTGKWKVVGPIYKKIYREIFEEETPTRKAPERHINQNKLF
jgi:asparagine synthetase B (glutamine-hydrolysing)